MLCIVQKKKKANLILINCNFLPEQVAVETKRGISQLELLFKEMQMEEAAKQRMKDQKKLKKRKKRESRRAGQEQNGQHEDKDGCEVRKITVVALSVIVHCV